MSNPDRSELKFVQATLMVLSVWPKGELDALFVHGRSFGDDTGLFDQGTQLYKDGLVGKIAIFNNNGERCGSIIPYQANPGKDYYKDNFVTRGVPEEDIIISVLSSCQTRQESDGFIDLSIREGWLRAGVLTQPHQALRTTQGTLQALKDLLWGMEVYSVSPKNVAWFTTVSGSQGTESKARWRHIEDEYTRISKYTDQGDIVSLDELFAYMEAREQGRLILGPLERGSELFYRGIL